MTRIKVCGITCPEDAECAAVVGVNVIGVNLFTGPRKITLSQAQRITNATPGQCQTAALLSTKNMTGEQFDQTIHRLADIGIHILQLYGRLEPERISGLRGRGFVVWLPIQVTGPNFTDSIPLYPSAEPSSRPDAILLDAAHPTRLGGTGQTADWETIQQARTDGRLENSPPIILAGGLNPQNVAQAIRMTKPWMVDVAGGVESAPGKKSIDKLRAFVSAVEETAKETDESAGF